MEVMRRASKAHLLDALPDGRRKTVLITGTSSGFGRMTTEMFAERGWNVVATMRAPDKETELQKLNNVLLLKMDVQDEDTVASAVSEAIEKFGKIDVLVNNAGYGSLGFFEGISMDEIMRQYQVNVFGAMRATKAVLPHMRKAKSGTIVNISSAAGGHTGPLGSIYYSSKWALEGWAECLSYELLPLGIQVKIVQPGAFKTDFGSRSLAFGPPPPDTTEYLPMLEATQKMRASSGEPSSPKPLVLDAIYSAATDGEVTKMRYPVFVETDPYGKLYMLRKTQGAEAQYAAVLAQTRSQQSQ